MARASQGDLAGRIAVAGRLSSAYRWPPARFPAEAQKDEGYNVTVARVVLYAISVEPLIGVVPVKPKPRASRSPNVALALRKITQGSKLDLALHGFPVIDDLVDDAVLLGGLQGAGINRRSERSRHYPMKPPAQIVKASFIDPS